MAIKIRVAGLAAVGAFLILPGSAFSQFTPPNGLSGGGQGWSTGPVPQFQIQGQSPLGPPPAGVLLHQQYMSLYGLPVNFNQNASTNQQSAYGGGYPGGYGGGYPGYPGYAGVNYRRQVAAMQMQAAYYNALAAAAYNNTYVNNITPSTSTSNPSGNNTAQRPPSFGTGYLSTSQPSFTNPTSPLPNSAAGFSGFGLNTANPYSDLTKKDDAKKDDAKKDDAKKDDSK